MVGRLIAMGVAAVGLYGLAKVIGGYIEKANPELKNSYKDYKDALKNAGKQAYENEDLADKSERFTNELERTIGSLKDSGEQVLNSILNADEELYPDDEEYDISDIMSDEPEDYGDSIIEEIGKSPIESVIDESIKSDIENSNHNSASNVK